MMEPAKKPKKKKIIIVSIVFALLVALTGGYFLLKGKSPISLSLKPEIKISFKGSKLQELVPCPMDGVLTTKDRASRHPIAVSIENYPDARPQSGLNEASLVYETPTEGGITRFLAFYVENDVSELGPVRSARIYFLDWLLEFDAPFAHCGGNADALAEIKTLDIKDLDEFTYAAPYWRSKDRYAPHNLYTSTENLWNQATKNNWTDPISYESWQYKDDLLESNRSKDGQINIQYANPSFRVSYIYNPKDNNYLRSYSGKAHIDEPTQKQLSSKNVALMWVSTWPLYDPENGWAIKTISEGQAKVFLDGKVVSGTWRKTSRENRTKFFDESGSEIVFNRGQTWICVLPQGTEIN